jgi:hypothetical protein
MRRLAFAETLLKQSGFATITTMLCRFLYCSFMMCRGVQAGSYGENHTCYGEYQSESPKSMAEIIFPYGGLNQSPGWMQRRSPLL